MIEMTQNILNMEELKNILLDKKQAVDAQIADLTLEINSLQQEAKKINRLLEAIDGKPAKASRGVRSGLGFLSISILYFGKGKPKFLFSDYKSWFDENFVNGALKLNNFSASRETLKRNGLLEELKDKEYKVTTLGNSRIGMNEKRTKQLFLKYAREPKKWN